MKKIKKLFLQPNNAAFSSRKQNQIESDLI